jgi:hypothetical protein
VNAAIIPKGTGAIVAAIPDGTAVGGDARGIYAVDLQTVRANANQVASGSWSKIGGGNSNTAAGYYNVIGGGFTNSGTASAAVTTQSATTTSGATGVTLAASNANIQVGQYITGTGIASDTYVAAISGTSLTLSKNASGSGTNTLSFFTPHGVVVGGGNNQATGIYSFIGGGGDAGTAANRNLNQGNWSVIVGGRRNQIRNTTYNQTSSFMTIGGGDNNVLSDGNPCTGSVIAGGGSNTINGSQYSVISGGLSNSITFGTLYNVIAGGQSNVISGENTPNYRTISGGFNNSGGSVGFTISGGQSNACGAGQYPSIGGGLSNTASGNYSRVGGGQTNTASATHTTVGGGNGNTAGSSYDVVCGGQSNATGGSNNSTWKFIGGGGNNTVSGDQTNYSGVACGNLNAITNGRHAFIGGGSSNTINSGGWNCTIGGGQSNYANGNGQVATHATIGGGNSNTTSAFGAIVTGGSNGIASLYCQQVHASGQFSAQGDAQAHELIWRRAITGTAQTELFLDGTSVAAILPGTNSVWNGIIDIAAICTVTGDGTTVVGHVEATAYKVTIKRIGTTTSLVGGVQEIGTTNADASMSTAVFTIDNNDTNESLRIRFTPPSTAGSTTVIRTVATFRGTQIQY